MGRSVVAAAHTIFYENPGRPVAAAAHTIFYENPGQSVSSGSCPYHIL